MFYCVRCRTGGRLPLSAYLRLVVNGPLRGKVGPDPDDWEELLDELEPGPGNERPSALDRFHLIDPLEGTVDVFLSRSLDGDIIGMACVSTSRKTITGKRGIGFAGDELVSSPEAPIRIVEGPYDVLSERDVCVFGLPGAKTMRQLKGHFVILCPDGDVWPDFDKRNTILKALAVTDGPVFLGVEMLKPDEDPDDVPYEERRRINPRRLLQRWQKEIKLARWKRDLAAS